jgi:hypothetical protein
VHDDALGDGDLASELYRCALGFGQAKRGGAGGKKEGDLVIPDFCDHFFAEAQSRPSFARWAGFDLWYLSRARLVSELPPRAGSQ